MDSTWTPRQRVFFWGFLAAGLGYPCTGGAGLSSGARFLAGWVPGAGAIWFPQGTGIEVPGGRKMLMQVHYNTAGGTVPDQTAIDLVIAPSVATPALRKEYVTSAVA